MATIVLAQTEWSTVTRQGITIEIGVTQRPLVLPGLAKQFSHTAYQFAFGLKLKNSADTSELSN
jgi:hypothetical protein